MAALAENIKHFWEKGFSWVRRVLGGRYSRLINISFALVTLAAAGGILYNQRETILTENWQFDYRWMGLTFLFLSTAMLLGAFGWHLLIKRLTGYPETQKNMAIWWQSNLSKRIPGNVWHLAYRMVAYERFDISKSQISMVLGLELVMILLSGLIVTIVSIPFWQYSADVITQVSQSWLIYPLGIACLILIHPRIISRIWTRLARSDETMTLGWLDSLRWLCVYSGTWILGGIVLFGLISSAFPLELAVLPQVIGMWSLAVTLSLIGALTFTNIGVQEVSLWLLLGTMMPNSIALIFVIASRLLWLILEFIFGLIGFRLYRAEQKT